MTSLIDDPVMNNKANTQSHHVHRLFQRIDSHVREILFGAGVSLSLKILGFGLALVFNIIIARNLGPEGAGTFFLSLTIITIGAVLGRIGLDNAMLRYVSANAAESRWHGVKGVYQTGMAAAFLFSAFVTIILFASYEWLSIAVFSKPELIEPLYWMNFAVVPMALLILHSEVLKGLGKILQFSSVQIKGVYVSGFSILFFLTLGHRYGIESASMAYVLAVSFTLLISMHMWRKHTRHLKAIKADFSSGQLFRTGMPLFGMNIMNLAMNWSGVLILGIWASSSDVGIFSVSLRIAMLTSFILVSVNSIAAPKFASLYEMNDFDTLASTSQKVTLIMTIIASPALLALILFPEHILRLFGHQFSKGAMVLSILSIGQFFNVATGSVGYLLMMTGNEKVLRNNHIWVGCLNIVLNLILIRFYGVIGAAVASAFTVILLNGISTYLVYRKMSFIPMPFPTSILPHKILSGKKHRGLMRNHHNAAGRDCRLFGERRRSSPTRQSDQGGF